MGSKVQQLGTNDEWEDVLSAPAHPVKIDVHHFGAVFVVDIFGNLHRYDGEDWVVEIDDNTIADVGVGSSGNVYVTTIYGEPQGFVATERVYIEKAEQTTTFEAGLIEKHMG